MVQAGWIFHKKHRFLQHLLFWICYWLFFTLMYLYYRQDSGFLSQFLSLGLSLVIDILAAYFTVYVLMQQILFRQKYMLFTALFFLSALLLILLQRVIIFYVEFPLFYPSGTADYAFFDFNPLYSFLNIYTVVGAFAAIKLLKLWFVGQQLKTEMENRQMAGELALLRSQVNPHFLFNTLNNIDTLIFEDQQKASDSIIMLSDIMRYMLYDAASDSVPLSQEIEYLQSFVALQRLRMEDQAFIEFRVEGTVGGRKVPPVLFIPFIENAFKHGSRNGPAPGIKINLDISDSNLKLEVVNYRNVDSNPDQSFVEGLGLTNARRRLELLFAGKHDLQILAMGGLFSVRLTIFGI